MTHIPLFPLQAILLPHTDLGLHVFEERYRELVSRCLENGEGFGVVTVADEADPSMSSRIGTLASIVGYARLPDGRYLLEVEGSSRFRIGSVNGSHAYPLATVEWIPESIGNFADARRAGQEAEQLFRSWRAQNGDGDCPVQLPVDPIARSYVLASLLDVDLDEKQRLLEAPSADVRLGLVVDVLRREMALLDEVRSSRG